MRRAGAAARAAARTTAPARAHDLGAARATCFFLAPGRDIIFGVATWVAAREVATWEVKSRHGWCERYKD